MGRSRAGRARGRCGSRTAVRGSRCRASRSIRCRAREPIRRLVSWWPAGSHHVTINDSSITGARASGGNGRNVLIFGSLDPQDQWRLGARHHDLRERHVWSVGRQRADHGCLQRDDHAQHDARGAEQQRSQRRRSVGVVGQSHDHRQHDHRQRRQLRPGHRAPVRHRRRRLRRRDADHEHLRRQQPHQSHRRNRHRPGRRHQLGDRGQHRVRQRRRLGEWRRQTRATHSCCTAARRTPSAVV